MAQSGRIQQVSQDAASDLGAHPAAPEAARAGRRASSVFGTPCGRRSRQKTECQAISPSAVIYGDVHRSPQDNRLAFGERLFADRGAAGALFRGYHSLMSKE